MTAVGPVVVDHEVIVVGGGPVGMLVANELALQGISALVLEKRRCVGEHPKAGTYHSRAVATLARRGILSFPRRTDDHTAISSEPFQFAGRPWITVRGRTIDGPVMMGIAQADLEQAIGVRAQTHGAQVRRGVTVTVVEQSDDHVAVRVRDEDGDERQLTARFVVGADGGRSVVLRSGEFATTECPPTMRALLGLAGVPRPEQVRAGWSATDRGWTLVNLNRFGDSRVVVFEFDGPVADRRAPVTPQEFRSAVDRVVGTHVELTSPHHLGRFSDYSRLAGTYRDRRLFVAGDAAHIHYPLGGQGLNTGIADAVNLGWKLAAVLSGAADDSLLDTYTQERQPVGRWVIDNTRLQAALMDPAPAQDPLRRMVSAMLCHTETHDWLGDRINGHSLRHDVAGVDDGLTGSFLPDHRVIVDGAGTTVARLLGTGRVVILLAAAVGGDVDRLSGIPFADVTVVDGLPETYPDVVVVRPDGYVAWAGPVDDPDQMAAALGERLGVRYGPSR